MRIGKMTVCTRCGKEIPKGEDYDIFSYGHMDNVIIHCKNCMLAREMSD